VPGAGPGPTVCPPRPSLFDLFLPSVCPRTVIHNRFSDLQNIGNAFAPVHLGLALHARSMSEFTAFDTSLDFLVSPGSGSKLGESSRSASGPSPDMTGGDQSGSGSGEKRASMDEQGEADSEGKKKQKFSRSRTACLQVSRPSRVC
jgi:hypothetical protein